MPTAALDETLGDLRQLGAAAKMGLLTYMPFGASQYWSWHEEPHRELVALAARYISSRKLRGWVHAPVWSHREYGFRVIDRVPPVRSTAPRRELERFLAR